jgi:hypothetical protein
MPTVTSETELCNLALALVGNDRQLTSLTEANKPARLCNLMYAPTRDGVLRAHPWNFAIRRVALAAESGFEDPTEEYDYRFPLPSDYLKIIRTTNEAAGLTEDYRIESSSNGLMMMSTESTMSIEYIARITDVALFDPLFVEALSTRLAVKLAGPLADSATLARELREAYLGILAEARSMDAQEGSPREFVVDTWINARA